MTQTQLRQSETKLPDEETRQRRVGRRASVLHPARRKTTFGLKGRSQRLELGWSRKLAEPKLLPHLQERPSPDFPAGRSEPLDPTFHSQKHFKGPDGAGFFLSYQTFICRIFYHRGGSYLARGATLGSKSRRASRPGGAGNEARNQGRRLAKNPAGWSADRGNIWRSL